MNTLFIREYVKNLRSVGAVAPSSRFLARKMVESIDFKTAKLIIEYGPGTGVFTAEIAKRMSVSTHLIVIETNPQFYKKLVERFRDHANIEIINTSAADTHDIVASRNISPPDYIVSGLPFAALPSQLSHDILRATALLLKDGGEFITFQYTLLKQNLLKEYFEEILVTRELRNIPPAYVLRCKNETTSFR